MSHLVNRNKLTAILFVGPSFMLYTIFIIISVGFAFYYSLTEWSGVGKGIFIGFENYKYLLSNGDFHIVLKNTALCMFWALLIQIPLGLVFAYLIFKTKVCQRIYRVLVFIPVVMAPASIALMFTLLFNADIGPVNNILDAAGLGMLKQEWLSNSNVVLYSVLTPMIYQFIGFYTIILLAGMQSIPQEILESAHIDGANSFKALVKIVIPTQWDIILICIILDVIGALKAFEHSYIMTWGGPGVRSSFLGVFMYMTTFLGGNFGQGTATAIIILVLALLITVLFKKITRRFEI